MAVNDIQKFHNFVVPNKIPKNSHSFGLDCKKQIPPLKPNVAGVSINIFCLSKYRNLPVQLANVFGNIICVGVFPLITDMLFNDGRRCINGSKIKSKEDGAVPTYPMTFIDIWLSLERNAVELNGVGIQTSKYWYKGAFTFEHLIIPKEINDQKNFFWAKITIKIKLQRPENLINN